MDNWNICQLEICLSQLNVGSGNRRQCSLVFRLWMLYEPINNSVNIGWVLARNHKATDFSISYRLESPARWRGIFKNHRNCLLNFLWTHTFRYFTLYVFSHGGWYWGGDHATPLQNSSSILLVQGLIVSTYIRSVRSGLDRAPCLSILLPNTSNGIPLSEGLLNKSWSSLLETDKFS